MGEYVTKHVPKYIFIHTPKPIRNWWNSASLPKTPASCSRRR